MKTQLLAAAAVAAALVAPVAAHAQTGYLDLSYRNVDAGLGVEPDGVSIGGGVATDLPVGGLKLQLNANHTRLSDSGSAASTSDFVGHVYTQNDSYALGGFVTATDFVGIGAYGVGVEGSKYLGNFTLGGVLAYNTIDNGLGHFNDYGVSAKWFATENLSFAANYDKIDSDDLGDADIWGAEAEWKLNNPVSLFASYSDNDDADVQVWGLGARWHFGGGSLKEQERSGAKAFRPVSAAARALF